MFRDMMEELEEEYEKHVIPPMKRRISELEAQITEFRHIIKTSDCTAGGSVVVEIDGEGVSIEAAYDKHFKLQNETNYI